MRSYGLLETFNLNLPEPHRRIKYIIHQAVSVKGIKESSHLTFVTPLNCALSAFRMVPHTILPTHEHHISVRRGRRTLPARLMQFILVFHHLVSLLVFYTRSLYIRTKFILKQVSHGFRYRLYLVVVAFLHLRDLIQTLGISVQVASAPRQPPKA